MLPFSLSSQTRLSSARRLQHWIRRLHCCFAGTGHQHVLDLTVDLTWHLLDHLHLFLCLCILHDVLITPSREWNLVALHQFSALSVCVAAFWHCISAGTSTFMYCYEASVLCCTFWMCCTCGNFHGLCNVWTIMSICCTCLFSFLCTLNLGSLDLLGHLIHSLDERIFSAQSSE